MSTEKKLKKSVKLRLAKEARKEFLEKNGGSQGEVQSRLKNVRISPRKMRLLVDSIRGKRVDEALNIVKFSDLKASTYVEKMLLVAVSDWQAKNTEVNLEDVDLFVSKVYVDGGKVMKRIRPAPQGRAHRIRKRSNHTTLVIDSLSKEDVSNAVVKQEKTKK